MTNEEANKKAIEYFRNVFSDAVCNNASLANPAYLAVKALKEQKTGRWIRKERDDGIYCECSNCGQWMPSCPPYNYCPNCGAKMFTYQGKFYGDLEAEE